ncbi:MAG: hypothetical protein R3F54_18490 [Alphaproteobacteria bacterium]
MTLCTAEGWPEGVFDGWPEGITAPPLLAIMTFPRDTQRQLEFCEAAREQLRLINCQEPKDLLFNVIQGARDRYLHDGNPLLRGSIAGHLLVILRQIAEHHKRHVVSLRKAMVIFEASARDDRTRGNKKIPTSRNSLLTIWSAYKPVAHLWAAYLVTMWTKHPDFDSKPDDELTSVFGDVPLLLSVAERMREFGERQMLADKEHGGAERPILDPAETFIVTADVMRDVELNLPPLAGDQLKALEGYQAPVS